MQIHSTCSRLSVQCWPIVVAASLALAQDTPDLQVDAPWTARWSVDIGAGFARPVVSGDVALVLARGESASLAAHALDDGAVRWQVPLQDAPRDGQEEMGGRAPHADPLILGDAVFTLGFGGAVTCSALADGALRWRVDPVEALGAKPVQFGFAASPIAVDGLVVVAAGAPGPGFVALEPTTGAVRWATQPYAASYVTPLLVEVQGTRHLVAVTGDETVGLDPTNGVERWRLRHVQGGLTNFAMIHVTADGGLCVSGQGLRGLRRIDLTSADGRWTATERWLARRAQFSHGRVIGGAGRVTGATSAQLTSVDAATGKLTFALRAFAPATLTPAGAWTVVLEEDGDLSLVRLARDRIEVFARAALGAERAWTAPVLAGDLLLVRAGGKLSAFPVPALAPDTAPLEVVLTGGASDEPAEVVEPPADAPPFPWSQADRARILGAWTLADGARVEFSEADDGALRARSEVYEGVTFSVTPESRTRAWVRALDAPYGIGTARLEVPDGVPDGVRPTSLTLHLGGLPYTLTRGDR